jgi:hypothetical protein
MKIHQLPYGARFLYQGEEYVKSGPMFGTGKDGQRIIPRYAVLQALDDPAAAPAASTPQSPDDAVSRAEVLRAFANFCLHCRALIADDQAGSFERARNQFLNAVR